MTLFQKGWLFVWGAAAIAFGLAIMQPVVASTGLFLCLFPLVYGNQPLK